MSRSIILWRTWDGSDMAQSDLFFASKSSAVAHLWKNYDVTPAMLKPDDKNSWSFDHAKYGDVHLARFTVEMTKNGIAEALTRIPHR
jgi:hypothetical protein